MENALLDAGFNLVELSPPGEGHKFLNDKTKQHFTVYKDGTGVLQSLQGTGNIVFNTPESIIQWAIKQGDSGNVLTDQENVSLKTLAASYGLDCEEAALGKNVVKYLVIKDKAGETLFTIRKMKNSYIVMKTNPAETVVATTLWDILWIKLNEALQLWSGTHSQPQPAGPSEISESEFKSIEDTVKKYQLTAVHEKPANSTSYVVIITSWGSRVYAIRKFEGMYYLLNSIPSDTTKWNTIDQYANFQAALKKLNDLGETFFGTGQLTEEQIGYIIKLVSNYNYKGIPKLMSMLPDDHPVYYLSLVDDKGEIQYMVGKEKEQFVIYKVFNNKTWDKWVDTKSFDEAMNKLAMWISNGATAGKFVPEPQVEHNGITIEEFSKIKDAVDAYSESKATYVKSSTIQPAHAVIMTNAHQKTHKDLLFIGALGNYYQINNAENKPIFNTGNFNDLIQHIHHYLTGIAGAPDLLLTSTFDKISNLLETAGFVGTQPEADEPYVFVKEKDEVVIDIHNFVTFIRYGAFGPIRHKPALKFAEWFKNIYLANNISESGEEIVTDLFKNFVGSGWMDKESAKVHPHQKINAIKFFRSYLMGMTGGNVGLAKAKWAIENWEQFMTYSVEHGLPQLDSDLPDHSGLFGYTSSQVEPQAPPSDQLALTPEEKAKITELVGSYAPTFQIGAGVFDSLVFYVYQNITSYKVEKIAGIYRVYNDIGSHWTQLHQVSNFNGLMKFLEELCDGIVKILHNSKMIAIPIVTQPASDENMLSESEIHSLQKLTQAFGLSIGVAYGKKHMQEAKKKKKLPSGKDAYSAVISDSSYGVWFKVHKKNNKYILEKSTNKAESYELLKEFDDFKVLLHYLDFYINGYTINGGKTPEQSIVTSIPDDQFAQIKQLVKAKLPQAKVRRKKMTSKGVTVPYVFIQASGLNSFAVGLAKGTYKIFKVDDIMKTWEQIFTTDSWEKFYDLLSKVLEGDIGEVTAENIPVLSKEQLEWLQTFMKTQKPGVLIKTFGVGVVGGYDPAHKVYGEDNPLFVIRPSHSTSGEFVLQVHVADGGTEYTEYSFDSINELFSWLTQNLDVATQLYHGDGAVEGKLASLFAKHGFEYVKSSPVKTKTKDKDEIAYIYENLSGEKCYLWQDGSSRIWMKDSDSGEMYHHDFKTIGELVNFLEDPSEAPAGEKDKSELDEIREYLASLGFGTSDPNKHQGEIWVSSIQVGAYLAKDYVTLHNDGTSKVTPSPLVEHGAPESSPFYFNTLQALKAYLTERFVKKADFHKKYFYLVIKHGKLKKLKGKEFEMGYAYYNDKLLVVPFPSGGIMSANATDIPNFRYSYQNTYDLGRRVELFLTGNADYQDPGWSSGDGYLDELIDDAGFHYSGSEEFEHAGQVLIFMHNEGMKLKLHTSDKSSSLTFGQEATSQQKNTITFDNPEQLKKYLEEAIQKQKSGDGGNPFPQVKPGADDWQNASILTYSADIQKMITQDLDFKKWNGVPSNAYDGVFWQYNNNGGGQGVIQIVKNNQLLFAIGQQKVASHILWYIRQTVSNDPSGLHRVYSFVTVPLMFDWIHTNWHDLCNFHVVKDQNGDLEGIPEQPMSASEAPPVQPKQDTGPGAQYFPEEHLVKFIESKGFKPKITPNGTTWDHPSKFHFTLHLNAVVWHSEKSTKEVHIPIANQEEFLKKALFLASPSDDDDLMDAYFSDASASNEEKLFDKAMGMAENLAIPYNGIEFSHKMESKGFEFDLHTHVWYNDDLYQVVAAVEPEEGAGAVFKVWWIDDHGLQSAVHISEGSLFDHIGPDGILNKKKSDSELEVEYKPPYPPSGETYKTHDDEANASLIWLNEHDEKVLRAMGFSRIPQENVYYKNKLGDIIKFRDTGKAEFIEYGGQPQVYDTVEFESIPHALKFIVIKYSTGPWSGTDYNTNTEADQIHEIALNHHDTFMLAQLGFKWDEKGHKYVKFYTKSDVPKLHPHHKTKPSDDVTEAKKKNKKDPNQPELDFNKPPGDWEDFHEVLTCYDTGNAIWELVKEDGHQGHTIEIYEETIPQVLNFLWLRWQHGVTKNLIGTKVTVDKQNDFTIPPGNQQKDLDQIKGMKMPPVFHNLFMGHEFEYDANKGEYHKKVENVDNLPAWILAKFDGQSYHITYPQKSQSGKLQGFTQQFGTTDPYYALNTIKKIENADFGKIVQSEDDALEVKDSKYYNAPNGWTPYNPYAPTKHPGNITPDAWIEAELEGYGFEWADASEMYWYTPAVDDPNVKGLLWEAIRFDKNGTIVYFYPGAMGTKGERRYFCSQDFSEVEQKIEMNHASSHHGQVNPAQQSKIPQKPTKNNGNLFDPKNYPKAPDLTQDFSVQGHAIPAVSQDDILLKKAGFQFADQAGLYINTTTKDQFKILSTGMLWYSLVGTGEGTSNDIGHFFDMLKSKYGVLEWASNPITLDDLFKYSQRLQALGYTDVTGEQKQSWTFERTPKDKKTTMNISERIILFPNHSMTFYLEDPGAPDYLGMYHFESATHGIHTLENGGPGGIALILGPEMDNLMHQRNFVHQIKTGRYEGTIAVDGNMLTITFYGDGIAWAHAMKPISAEEVDIVFEKKFDSFYNAVAWAADKTISEVPDVQTIDQTMKQLGLVAKSKLSSEVKIFANATEDKEIQVNLTTGKVRYHFQYVSDPTTGEVEWGQSVFKEWKEFQEFITGKIKKKPQGGEIAYTPHPSTKQPVLVQPMPFSGFDYENWAKGTDHDPNASIALMPEDDNTMKIMGFKQEKVNDTYFYSNGKGDVIYFFVDGRARWHKTGTNDLPTEYSSVKTLLEHLWAMAMHTGFTLPKPPKSPKKIQTGKDVQEDIKSMGFAYKQKNVDGHEVYYKKSLPDVYEVIWDFHKDTIEFIWALKTKGETKIKEHWTLNTIEALAKLHEGFDAIPKKKSKKKVLAGTEGMPWSGTDYKKYWVNSPENIGLALSIPTDDKLMKHIGWEPKFDQTGGTGIYYENGNQKMIFHKHGKVFYWSSDANGVTQDWDDPEDAIRWAYKQWKLSHHDKISVKLEGDDLETIKKMGFTEFPKTEGHSTKYIYVKLGYASAIFYENGEGWVWDLVNQDTKDINKEPNPPIYAGSFQDCLNFIAKEYVDNPKFDVTGQVPYSGTDYKHWWKTYWPDTPPQQSISLKPEDTSTLEQIGFTKNVVQTETSIEYQVSYANSFGEVLYFFAGGEAAYWHNGEGPKYYGNAKNLMQAMWDKYSANLKTPTATKTGDVPFSGTDYANEFKDFDKSITHHLTNDHSVMMKMGFKPKTGQAGDGMKTAYYQHPMSKDVVYFFSDGHAGYFPENKTPQGQSFKTVKDCLQFLWDKYMPHI